jgi:hypothetical protein
MRYFLTGLLLVVVCGCSSSVSSDPPREIRYGDISGTAYLDGTAEPLSGVEVSIGDRSDTTTGDGTYEIDSIPEGSHTLTASHADYETYDQTVEITGNTVHDIQLMIAIETGNLHGHVLHPVYGPVSGARILIADSLDYSDINGAYSLTNIPVGLQTLTCTRPGPYHDFVGSLYITNSENEYDITMIRTVENRILVGSDATVQRHDDSTYYNVQNYGWNPRIWVHQESYLNSSIKSRIFIGLPALPEEVDFSELEAATLRMYVAAGQSTPGFWSPRTLAMRRVISPWAETEITWNTKPEVDTSYIFAKVKPPQSGFFDIDVLQIYHDGIDSAYGVRFALDSDENGIFKTETVEIYSSEARDTQLSPAVIFRYTH